MEQICVRIRDQLGDADVAEVEMKVEEEGGNGLGSRGIDGRVAELNGPIESESAVDDDRIETWKGRFCCQKPCEKMYDCGIHMCKSVSVHLFSSRK